MVINLCYQIHNFAIKLIKTKQTLNFWKLNKTTNETKKISFRSFYIKNFIVMNVEFVFNLT